MPADTIKLDMYFARNCIKTHSGRIILGHIISMLHEINYNIICEGIETLEDKTVINKLGCDQIQGYFYSKPISCNEFYKKYIE